MRACLRPWPKRALASVVPEGAVWLTGNCVAMRMWPNIAQDTRCR